MIKTILIFGIPFVITMIIATIITISLHLNIVWSAVNGGVWGLIAAVIGIKLYEKWF